MMIGLCELNLGGCHEGESSEPMPALTLGQGVEQNFQRVIRNSTNDKIGILSHEGNGHGNPAWRHEHAQKMQNGRLGHALCGRLGHALLYGVNRGIGISACASR